MLTFSEIAQLSDRDLADEITNSKNSLFRQKMGVRTKHLKDSHLVKILKKYVAQLLTEKTRRECSGEKIEKTSAEVAKKSQDFHAEIEKKQIVKKEKAAVKKTEKVDEPKVETKSSTDVKVKKVEKKGLFSRKKKVEKES
jgi:ribosomal protein L29